LNLTWIPAESADEEHPDVETSGELPPPAVWASVTHEGWQQWRWGVWPRWLWQDIDEAGGALAEGFVTTVEDGKTAVLEWLTQLAADRTENGTR
jgi:hypothetical protein